jgi:phosphatidylglycerophosphate synthase
MILFEAILSGIWATFFMDSLAKILSKRGIIYPFISSEAMGRWFLYMCKGKYAHTDINRARALNNEKAWYYLSHYLIGIILLVIAAIMTLLSMLNYIYAARNSIRNPSG